jgi:hypothetical protein
MSETEPREGRPEKKIAILGFADSWKQAPFADDTVEMWGLNELHKYVPRWDRWFELHDSETLGATVRDLSEGEQKRHLEWLSREHGKPIYMQPQFVGRFPNAIAYPLEAMCQTFGRYFTSSIGYMVALAISEGATWIGLYGIDLASDIEYPHQRPNTEYLIGLARGKGIHVEIAPGAAVCKAGFLYGYEKEPAANPVAAAVRNHKTGLDKKRDELLATLNTIDGAIQESENVLKLIDYQARGCQITSY